MTKRPLEGIVVLDLSVTIPGPYATRLLGRLGASVIKAEPPAGDVTAMTPELYRALNEGKDVVTLDLKTETGRDTARGIATGADVVVEGWRPGVADRLGVGYQALRAAKPSLVYCSISGFGADGPLRDRAAHDINYVALAGMTQVMFGDATPLSLNLPLADLAGGTFAALRVCAALVPARDTGSGCHIDASLAGAVREWVDALGATAAQNPAAGLNELPHYGVFTTADGHHLTLGTVHEDHFWRPLCGVLGMDDVADLGFMDRFAKAGDLRARITEIVASRTRPDLEAALADTDTCWAFVDPPREHDGIGGRLPR
jgi:crotonobetainyl-CoA:carnitine CoA-transferase CaiB-like acyl-CoA transferase